MLQIEDVAETALDKFQIRKMFDVWLLDDDGKRARRLILLSDITLAEVYKQTHPNSAFVSVSEVWVLTDGTTAFFLSWEEPEPLQDEPVIKEELVQKSLAGLTSQQRRLLGIST
jgi:hypothetical protein